MCVDSWWYWVWVYCHCLCIYASKGEPHNINFVSHGFSLPFPTFGVCVCTFSSTSFEGNISCFTEGLSKAQILACNSEVQQWKQLRRQGRTGQSPGLHFEHDSVALSCRAAPSCTQGHRQCHLPKLFLIFIVFTETRSSVYTTTVFSCLLKELSNPVCLLSCPKVGKFILNHRSSLD